MARVKVAAYAISRKDQHARYVETRVAIIPFDWRRRRVVD